MNLDKAAESVVAAARSYIDKRLAELVKNLPTPEKGEKGNDGASVTVEDVRPIIDDVVKAAFEALPKAENGKDADPEVIKQLVDEAVAALPAAKDGQDGKDADPETIKQMVSDAAADILLAVKEQVETLVKTAISTLQESLAKTTADLVANALAEIPKAQDGRDGLEIEIEPSIDLDKSYPRSIYAMHEGGLWRSHSTTKGIRGWECIVAGVAALDIEHDGERSFTISAIKSDGAVSEKTVSLPVMIYRGVYSEGTEYKKGDTVTWAGSVYHCNKDTSDKPGTDNWTLAAKRGRDGKDGKDLQLKAGK